MTTHEKEPFWVHCGKCCHEWAPIYLPVTLETFGRLKHNQCPMCGSKKVIVGEYPKPTDEGDPIAWLTNGDTGTSSLTIWSVMMGRSLPAGRHAGIPRDPSDFGRCYRLLRVMPSWRSRLSEVVDRYPEWRALVDVWGELTALYEEEITNKSGMAPKLYARIQAVTDGKETISHE